MADLALSVLDLAPVRSGETVGESLAASVALARLAEQAGYRRVWYAEHHNMKAIASSATSVLIAHVAAHTERIRLGAGGIMLPNHSPLQIAEQFGTLESLHPGRIDLGLGRAPGSDQNTMYALRRDPRSADSFPQDVLELQAFLAGESKIPGVQAFPGSGTRVPLYILGSSLFGAQLAAALGLPYAFASHFAPHALHDAVETYRREFQPSEQLDAPYVIAGVNAIAADTQDDADAQFQQTKRQRVRLFARPGLRLSDDDCDAVLASPQGAQIASMVQYSAVGRPADVRDYLESFAKTADADELIVALQSPDTAKRLRSAEMIATELALA
ncbi:LLM class flavin-dependent oxidoreductase [Jatrophihabitans endophyticus]|uniref:LLM class flavin-dependent oxidoreductase n=1 Tax=Jatrophihabitans endophyticus TaxID=1206085 RepID=UPI0019ECB4F2|nr:LLM class flavin-dependent oxidoreductase [Jatrophihabitans endophyticus]MBE7188201.1 LLM class flavin-dependent oxidoreductase [Jatrophihabitans endophyticus]